MPPCVDPNHALFFIHRPIARGLFLPLFQTVEDVSPLRGSDSSCSFLMQSSLFYQYYLSLDGWLTPLCRFFFFSHKDSEASPLCFILKKMAPSGSLHARRLFYLGGTDRYKGRAREVSVPHLAFQAFFPGCSVLMSN